MKWNGDFIKFAINAKSHHDNVLALISSEPQGLVPRNMLSAVLESKEYVKWVSTLVVECSPILRLFSVLQAPRPLVVGDGVPFLVARKTN